MARAASKDIVILGSRRKAKLEAITRRASAPQALARRARIVLLAHAGWPNAQIAAELGCAAGTVRTWRRRFARGGIPALAGRPAAQRPARGLRAIRQAGPGGRSHLRPAG
jgi:DNA-binding CsgD family transcriptional regulator